MENNSWFKIKRDINFDIIPKRYENLTEKYHKLFV